VTMTQDLLTRARAEADADPDADADDAKTRVLKRVRQLGREKDRNIEKVHV